MGSEKRRVVSSSLGKRSQQSSLVAAKAKASPLMVGPLVVFGSQMSEGLEGLPLVKRGENG